MVAALFSVRSCNQTRASSVTADHQTVEKVSKTCNVRTSNRTRAVALFMKCVKLRLKARVADAIPSIKM